MPLPLVAYRAAIAVVRGVAPIAALGSTKLRLGLQGRVRSAADFQAWGRVFRDRSRPLFLFHAASAGELRQAEPVIRRLRSRHPDWQLGVTCFSPSGAAVAESLPVDIAGLLPWDTSGWVASFLSSLAPTAIVITRADLWPLLILTARDRGIRLGLIAAAVREGSSRLRWPARRVLAPAYAALDLAAAVGPEDVLRLVSLGVAPERIVVAGDPRYDAVMERLAFRPSSIGESTLVAGSTWPRDERVLLTAFAEVHRAWEGARLIIAPHEPSPRALARIAVLARRLRVPEPRSYRDAVIADPLRVVDEVGPLAVLYGLGSIAYVGGGFSRSGLHSVLEPAAWSMPVIVGPRSLDNPDANRLAGVRALERLPARAPARALQARWLHWLEHPDLRREAGAEALAAVEAGTGAADRCADLVERLV